MAATERDEGEVIKGADPILSRGAIFNFFKEINLLAAATSTLQA